MKTGIVVALAWPETYCKQAGGWYDDFLRLLGFNQGHFYQAGHSALLLIKEFEEEIHYFDFGRYHAPKGFGRVRSAKTDPELTFSIKANWSTDGDLQNLKAILTSMVSDPAYHGDGTLHASTSGVDFDRAFAKAQEIQDRSPVKYGPFTFGGTNCSRFVNTVLRHSNPGTSKWLKLYFPLALTPTPMSNVRSLGNTDKYGNPNHKGVPFCSNPKSLLPAPIKPNSIPNHAQWLSGEGAGSWFTVDEFFGDYLIHRFSPSGQIEFGGVYELIEDSFIFNLEEPFDIIHLSHFQKVTIRQGTSRIALKLQAVRNLNSRLDIDILAAGGFRKEMVN